MLRFYPLRLLSKNSKGHAKTIAGIAQGPGSIKHGSETSCLSRSSSSSVYSAHQHSPFMKKLLNKKGGKTTKKRWFEPHFKESLEFDAPKTKKGPSERHLTRLRQVSHVLYDKVSHLVNSGELCQEVLEKQVNITSVKLHNNMKGINVFWDADRSDWEVVERLLDSKKGKLRSLLISYRVIGNIPPITFVRAKQIYNLSHLNGLLDVADYGPDYVPGLTPNEIRLQHREEREESEESATSLQSTPVSAVPSQFNREGDDISQFSNLSNEDVEFQYSVVDFHGAIERKAEGEEVPPQSVKIRQFIQEEGENSTCVHDVETLNQVNGYDEQNSGDFMKTTQLQFRSDLYGLKRDDLLKKISAKKKGLPSSENITQTASATNTFRFNFGAVKNAAFVKEVANRQARKRERKRKGILLDRDTSDFL